MAAPTLDDLSRVLQAAPTLTVSWERLLEGGLAAEGLDQGLYAVTGPSGLLAYIGRSTQLRHQAALLVGGLVTQADAMHVLVARVRAEGWSCRDLGLAIYVGMAAWQLAPGCIKELRPPLNHDDRQRGRRGHWCASKPDLPLSPPPSPAFMNSRALIASVTRKVRST